MSYRIYPHIRSQEDLGNAHLGDPKTSIVPVAHKHRADRAESRSKLAEA